MAGPSSHEDIGAAVWACAGSNYQNLAARHHDGDEVAWVLAGEFTFMIGDAVTVGGPGTCAFMPRDVPHAWKNTGREIGRVLFLYTPAAAGSLIEELPERHSANDEPVTAFFARHRWKILGQNPL